MRKFYQSVDLRSRKAMTDFLEHHFRYPTMNSWNGSYSYACNLKIYKLGLDQEIADKLYEMLDIPEFFYFQSDLVNDFAQKHDYVWQARFNGRSGGYLVLYQGIVNTITPIVERMMTRISRNGNVRTERARQIGSGV